MIKCFAVPLFVAMAALAAAPAWSAIESRGDVSYMNGGIGKEEADEMRAQAPRFPVELQFVRINNGNEEFVVDVAIRIADRAGRVVLDLPGQGPMFLVNLPDGEYTIDLENDGEVKTRHVLVSHNSRPQKLAFVWS